MKYLLVSILFLLTSNTLSAQWYYKTPSGKKYHKGSCRMVDNVSKAIRLGDALKMGLGPCKICKPKFTRTTVDRTNISNTHTNSARGSQASVQCKGYTRKKKRCKRKTKIGNGYCFQHNPDRDNYIKPSNN